MSHQISEGNFDPSTEFVDVAGTFNSWGGTVNALSDPDGDEIWEATITDDDFIPGNTIEFKFRYNGAWDDREEFPGAGNNRSHTVGETDETLSYWYNDEEPPTGPAVAGIGASSTFVFSGGSIYFEEAGEGLVENVEWIFEGGTPATSSEFNVSVVYETPGTYDVTLLVSNDFSEDELILEDYITVGVQDKSDLAWWNDEVFYEIFVRSFYDSDGDGIGDFKGITEKLDYLNDGDPETTTDLGITGIWLMPIHDSPSYHGYDVNDYRSINPDYGTLDDFKEFLDAAHERGIKVIIDLVLNHSSTQIDWFQEAVNDPNSDKRNWYRWEDSPPNYNGPWGQNVWHWSNTGYYYGLFFGGMPDLNYEEPALKQEIFDITDFWLEDVGIDGFRLDAVKFIIEDGSVLEDLPETHAFWREWVAATKEANPNALSVGEAWTNTEKVVPYVINEGLDICFEFDLAGTILYGVRNQDADAIGFQMNKVINNYPYYQFGTFTTNHDMNRLMDEMESSDELVKLAATAYLTLPGVPFIYYGEEIGMLGSKPDENIRRPLPWDNGINNGFSTSSPWHGLPANRVTNNILTQQEDPTSIFNWYRKLVQLRTSNAALQVGDYEELLTDRSNIYAFKRTHESEEVVVVMNLSNTTQSVDLDLSWWQNTVDEPTLVDRMSGARHVFGSASSVTVELPAQTAQVLELGSPTLSVVSNLDETRIYPNPTTDHVIIRSLGSEFRLRSLEGKLIQAGEMSGLNTLLDLSLLNTGTYLLEIKDNNQLITKKLLIK